MRFKLKTKKIIRVIISPIIFGLLFESYLLNNKVLSQIKITPASTEDLSLYLRMGITYTCNASRKEIDLDFEKALSVAASTFLTVVNSQHGGVIIEQGKEIKIEPEILYNNISFRILGGAINVCEENVPQKSKDLFEKEIKRIEDLNNK